MFSHVGKNNWMIFLEREIIFFCDSWISPDPLFAVSYTSAKRRGKIAFWLKLFDYYYDLVCICKYFAVRLAIRTIVSLNIMGLYRDGGGAAGMVRVCLFWVITSLNTLYHFAAIIIEVFETRLDEGMCICHCLHSDALYSTSGNVHALAESCMANYFEIPCAKKEENY